MSLFERAILEVFSIKQWQLIRETMELFYAYTAYASVAIRGYSGQGL